MLSSRERVFRYQDSLSKCTKIKELVRVKSRKGRCGLAV